MDEHCLLVKVSYPDLKRGLVVNNLEMLEKGDNLWFTSRTYEAAVVTQHWAFGKESHGDISQKREQSGIVHLMYIRLHKA